MLVTERVRDEKKEEDEKEMTQQALAGGKKKKIKMGKQGWGGLKR